MARTRKVKYPFGLFKYDHSGGFFVCSICQMPVERRDRTMHLKTHHPDVYNKYLPKIKKEN